MCEDKTAEQDLDLCRIRLDLAGRLISRSQAREFLTGAYRFRKVIVSGDGIEVMRPAFADEMFRVWPLHHPEVDMELVGFSGEARRWAGYVIANHLSSSHCTCEQRSVLERLLDQLKR